MQVTRLERQKSGRRYNLYLDGEFAMALAREVVEQRGLEEGAEVTSGHLKILRDLEARDSTYRAALRLLGYRPRSEQELRRRLRLKGMTSRSIEPAIARLRRAGLLDDEAYARFYVESRQNSSPRSRRLLGYELRTKGVESETVGRAVDGVDEGASAYNAAAKRARRLRDLDYPTFQRRLASFLAARGFTYGTIQGVVSRLWNEANATSGSAASVS
jgi:regulatory protein